MKADRGRWCVRGALVCNAWYGVRGRLTRLHATMGSHRRADHAAAMSIPLGGARHVVEPRGILPRSRFSCEVEKCRSEIAATPCVLCVLGMSRYHVVHGVKAHVRVAKDPCLSIHERGDDALVAGVVREHVPFGHRTGTDVAAAQL